MQTIEDRMDEVISSMGDGETLTPSEIAERIGCSTRWIQYLLKRACNKLKTSRLKYWAETED